MKKPTVDYEAISSNISHLIDDNELWSATVQVVAALPPGVQSFVFSHCVFFSVPWGRVVPSYLGLNWFTKKSKDHWMIMLAENPPKREMKGIIAHEIAHAWLRHDVTDHENDPSGIETETAAANLAREWGFKGKATDPSFATRGLKREGKTQ